MYNLDEMTLKKISLNMKCILLQHCPLPMDLLRDSLRFSPFEVGREEILNFKRITPSSGEITSHSYDTCQRTTNREICDPSFYGVKKSLCTGVSL